MLLTRVVMSVGNAQVGVLLLYVAYLYLYLSEADAAATTAAECAGGFDVHRDKIIRTEESTAMGAQFLDETELPTRTQCLELCCGTPKCDVFVYEEKNPGSCYMFHCGPPDDFRCKFSRHANYSSAVLTTPRAPHPAQQQQLSAAHAVHLSQHEQELANLRSHVVPSEYRHTSTKPPLVAKTAHHVTTPPPKVKSAVSAAEHCSAYQFACHSGECIAVYNACDGIPQCIDGSDEAAELQCPPAATAGQLLLQQAVQKNVQPVPQVAARPIIPIAPYDKPVPLGNIYNSMDSNMPDLKEIQDPPRAHANWMPRQSNEQQYDSDSRIFSHKGGFQLIASQFVDPQPESVHPANAFREAQEVYRNHAGDVWQLEHLQQKPINQQQNPWAGRQPPILIPTLREIPNKNIQSPQWGQDWGNQPIENDMPPVQVANKKETHQPANVKLVSKPAKPHIPATSKPEQDYADEEGIAETPSPAKQVKKVKHGHHKTDTHKEVAIKEHDHPMHEHLQLYENRDEVDGEAERPGGAVLSLTLGICITAALAVLVGCRLRSVKRRVRRHGKSPHAHDPDYLVNGMYL